MRRLVFPLITLWLFASVFVAAPAEADGWNVGIGNLVGDCVQFDWRGGTATYTGSGAGQFTVDVNNLVDNRIGGGSRADSWSIYVNDAVVVASSVIEVSQVSAPVSGDWTVTVQGIDAGFWAGWYGPTFCHPTFTPDEVVPVEPPYVAAAIPTGDYRLDEGAGTHIVAPAGQVIASVTAWYGDPNDFNNGADWSAEYTQQLAGLTEGDLNSGNYFGDPVPGVYKVLIATVYYSAAPVVEPTPEPSVSTTPDPTPEPTIEPTPTPEPTVTPTPEVTPVEQPSTPAGPVVTPTPEPTPTQPPVVEPTPTPEPTPSPGPVDVRPSEPPVTEVTPEPTPEPTPDPTPTASAEPSTEPEPSPAPPETPSAEPSTEPSPEPTLPDATPSPTSTEPATPTPQPTLEPTPEITATTPEPTPSSVTPTQKTESNPPSTPDNTPTRPQPESTPAPIVIPDNASPAEISAAINAANDVLAVSEPGSPAYEEALQVLAEAAVADDPEVPEEIASVPFVGPAAVAVLQAFNAVGNIGADMAPATRKKAKKVVTAAVILTQIAAAATSMTASISRRNK